jgi:protein lifeguard
MKLFAFPISLLFLFYTVSTNAESIVIKSSPLIIGSGSTNVNPKVWRTSPGQSFESSNNHKDETKQPLQYDKRTLSDFSTRGSRAGFVRKVYSIFSAQMICTIAITGLIMNDASIKDFLFQYFKIFMTSAYLISTAVVVALVANPKLRYQKPYNFILLGLHTIMQSTLVGIFSSSINPRLVCLGTMHTLGTFLAITLYSFQPNEKFDLTPFGNVLLTGSASMLIGLFLNFFLKMPILDNIISGGLAVLFASYMAFDTQKIVGGKHHKYQYSQKEYILAALNLYQDVINFFIQIMNILMKLEKKNNNIK